MNWRKAVSRQTIAGLRQRIRAARFRTLLFGALAALMLLVWAGSGMQLWAERSSYIELAQHASESLSLALTEYTRQSLENIDNTLEDVATQSREWSDPKERPAAAEYLRILVDRDSVISSIRLYDATGHLWLASEQTRPAFADVSQQEDFLAHKAGTSKGMFVGIPQRTPAGEWRYPMSRRISGPQNQFWGMAVIHLDITTLDRFFKTLDVGEQGLIVLLRRDTMIWIRRPALDSSLGRLPANATIPLLLASAPQGPFVFTSRSDKVERVAYYRTVEPYPVVAAVAIAMDHALAPWYRLLLQFGVTLGLISIAVFLLGWLVAWQHSLVERAEARARERQQQLESISLNMPAVVFQRVRSPEGRPYYTFVDPKIREVFGVEPEQVAQGVGALQAVTHPEDLQGILVAFDRSAHDMTMWLHEFRILPPHKGQQWIRGAATPRPGPQGSIVWDGVYFDITAQKQAEEHLQQSHRMETVGQLSSGIAHQFNNLLMSIQGHLELIQLETEEDKGVSGNASAALDAVQRGATLTRQLLAFSRRQRLDPTAFNLNEALKETGDLLGGLMGRSINITFNLQSALPGVRLDRGQFQTAVVALALNAKEAMPNGGNLAFSTTIEEVSEQDARAAAASPGRYVTVRVRDSGLGMDEAVQARAFEPFFSTKGMGQGTGLGLSQVHGFMKQIGGYARLVSGPAKGTEVALFFPTQKETEIGKAPKP